MSGFPAPGDIFEGKYRVVDLLGSGGFARVYRAEQTDLARMVALKILSPRVSVLPDDDSVDNQLESVSIRFEREARVVSRLRSPYTITVYDYGRTESGLLYMVLEYIDGVELDQVEVPMAPRRVAFVLEQVLKSLQEAHTHGLLHRDLKPANIMLYDHLGERDQVKLLDFGIAKLVDEAHKQSREEQDLTAADSLIGTPRYMAPEQIRGEAAGPAADLYSLGLVVYELLAGEKAITNSDSIEILSKHLSLESFKLPPGVDVHPELRAIVERMLEKDVSRRYATAGDVLGDVRGLKEVRGDLTGSYASLPPVPFEELDDDSLVFEGFEQDEDEARAKPWVWVGVAAVVILLLVAGVWAVRSGGEDTNTAGGPTDAKEAAQVVAGVDPDEEEAVEEQEAEREEPPPVEPEPVDPSPVTTRVESNPPGALVYVEQRLVGEAPASFSVEDELYPLTVRVELAGVVRERELERAGGTHAFDLEAEIEAARLAEEAARAAQQEDRREASRQGTDEGEAREGVASAGEPAEKAGEEDESVPEETVPGVTGLEETMPEETMPEEKIDPGYIPLE